VCATAALLAGCNVTQSISDLSRIEYKTASQGRGLEVPPDLVSPRTDDRYAIPSVGAGTTYSSYAQGKASEAGTAKAVSGVLPEPPGVRMEREGDRRWLVVDQPPEQVWPVVREFWVSSGFALSVDAPEAGVVETEWNETRPQVPDSMIRQQLSRFLGSVYTSGTRDKYRTRLEPVASGTGRGTEVYVSHRGMVEELTGAQKDSSFWRMSGPNPDLEAEFLRRIMVRLSPQKVAAANQPAGTAATQNAPRAELIQENGQPVVRLQDNFERSWRQVGLVLDRSGFTVEDRDRSKGNYFVRYVDPLQEVKKPGLFDKVFGTGPQKDLSGRKYRIVINPDGQGSKVGVLNEDGSMPTAEADRRIATQITTVLRDQLR
jgi:outer membrane protein assembly factor BamC